MAANYDKIRFVLKNEVFVMTAMVCLKGSYL
jgi:hypothetical protein